MTEIGTGHIRRLNTGVPGLDRVLNFEAVASEGGLPEYSFNVIAGGPGAGKTTMAQQIMFANATSERPALYFTVLGEPALKMLRYQRNYRFFDLSKVGSAIHFENLTQDVLDGTLQQVLEKIVRTVEERNPTLVFVDSFRTVTRSLVSRDYVEVELQEFVQRLALYLSTWEATTFLVGEYSQEEEANNPVFTVADTVIWLFQSVDRNSVVRKLQVLKVRGQEQMSGLQTFRISRAGVQVYPRISRPVARVKRALHPPRLSTGVPGLDEMTGGGIPQGDAVILAGPSGSGKTVLATQFIAAGVHSGQPGVAAIFEEHPDDYERRAKELGIDLPAMIEQGQLEIVYLHPLDLSVDEALHAIQDAVGRVRAQRVVIDSLSGFELTLAPTFRQDYQDSLYRLVSTLTGSGITMLMTVEVVESFTALHFSAHEVSFLSDDIIYQRYVEIEGALRRVMTVVKMRSSSHSSDLREYRITSHGMEIGRALSDYEGIITGTPRLREAVRRPAYPGLSTEETTVLDALIAHGEATVPSVVKATQLRRSTVTAALDQLVDLTYALRVVAAGRTVYRPVGPALQR